MPIIDFKFAVKSFYIEGDVVRIEYAKFYLKNGLKALHLLHCNIGKVDAGRLQGFTQSRTP